MSKAFTSKGDEGLTGLLGEGQYQKNSPVFETLGTLDEVSATLGMARAVIRSSELKEILLQIQRDLYKMMAEISTTPENAEQFTHLTDNHIRFLEDKIEWMNSIVELPQGFIVPGDDLGGAIIDLARAITRRAERKAFDLAQSGNLFNPYILKYLNRLSSLLFVIEVLEDHQMGIKNITMAKDETTHWEP
jgi:cob(I)alamin adenosyltransferase